MTEWSKHVHRFAKKHNMSYKQANVSKKCKEAYKKRKTSPRRMNAFEWFPQDVDYVKTLNDRVTTRKAEREDMFKTRKKQAAENMERFKVYFRKKEEIFSQYPDTIEGIGRAMRDPRMIALEQGK